MNITIIPEMSWSKSYIDAINASNHPDIKILDNLTVVVVENRANNAMLQHCTGITMAIDFLRNNPDKKILLSGILPIEMVRKQKPEVDILLKNKNVRFLELPYSIEDTINIWKESSTFSVDSTAITTYNRSIITMILHCLKVADPKQPRDSHEESMVNEAVLKAKNYFPYLTSLSNDKILDFLLEASAGRELVRKGEYLEGVFCDIEGTLIVNGNINEKVLSVLKKYETEGKQITLWTDGNPEDISKILISKKVNYSLNKKLDFAGAEVEIAIDNMDEFTFNAHTKISSKIFIQAN